MHLLHRFLVSLTILLVGCVSARSDDRPNVLFIVFDDLKPTLGCYGDKLAKTPNMDRLAARGTVFERAYCNQAVCSPSRNAMLTGLLPQTLGIYDLATNFRQRVPEVKTLPQWFKEHGYSSHAVGKIFHVGHGNHEDAASWSVAHFPSDAPAYALPENRPFATSTPNAAATPDGTAKANGAAFESADVPDDTYKDGITAREAVKRLQEFKKTDTPFFLAVGFSRPHLPFVAPKKYWERFDPASFETSKTSTPPLHAPPFAATNWSELRGYRGIPASGPIPPDLGRTLVHGYYAATSYSDAQLGRVLNELDALGLSKNTIVILLGDHGWHLGDHGMWCKHSNYEQATHTPLIISAPGKPLQSRVRALAEFSDVYGTVCELAGMAKPSHLQGSSLVDVMKEASPGKAAAFQVYPRGSPSGQLLGQAARTDRWRYVEWQKRDGTIAARELYDMKNDQEETVNVADKAENEQVVARHSALIRERLSLPTPAGLKILELEKRAAAKRVK